MEGQRKSLFLIVCQLLTQSSPSFCLQLRYLQTLNSIAAEHNSTIIFPMPMNILDHFLNRGREKLAEKMS